MPITDEPSNLEELIDQLEDVAQDNDAVAVRDILATTGDRSFGPLLLVAGLITLAPVVGDIPGVPTIIGALVFLISIQLLFHRQHLWLPQWLLNRSVDQGKVLKSFKWMRKPARFVDKFLHARWRFLAEGTAAHAIAAVALVIAAAMPLMEFIPFSANAAGGALTAMGLGLLARDGVLTLIAFIIVSATIALLVYHFV